MSKNTRITSTPPHLRFLYVQSQQTATTLDRLLTSFNGNEDLELQIAINDARNVLIVLAHRTANKMGLTKEDIPTLFSKRED